MAKRDSDRTDSVNDMEDRKARIKAEAAELEAKQGAEEARRKQAQMDRDLASSESEAKNIEYQAGLIQEGETRDQLLERVRRLREGEPAPAYAPPPLTEFQRERINVEAEAGRAASAKAEAEQARFQETRKKAEEERLVREGHMSTVQHPNPSQDEKFPTNTRANALK